MLQNYLFTNFAANTTVRVPLNGASFIRATQGNAAFTIRVFKGSDVLFIASTWQAGLSCGPLSAVADYAEIVNGATQQTIEIYAGDAPVIDNRLVGTVNITGGIASKPIGATAFDTAGQLSISATAATPINTPVATALGEKVTIQNIGVADICISGNATFAFGAGLILSSAGAYPKGGGSVELSANVQWNARATGAKSVASFVQSKFT